MLAPAVAKKQSVMDCRSSRRKDAGDQGSEC